jgi:hypothetical protein
MEAFSAVAGHATSQPGTLRCRREGASTPSKPNQIVGFGGGFLPFRHRDATVQIRKYRPFLDGLGARVISTRERSSFWSVVTVEVLNGFPSVIAQEALPGLPGRT